MEHIVLNTPSGTKSDIFCGSGAFESIIPAALKERNSFLLTDSNVYSIYNELIERTFAGVPKYVMPAGEANKNSATLMKILESMIGAGLHRSSCLFALGGGVIGDIGGLAAALYMRGIHCVQIPTTLLAQVDSSVGGKTAVDFGMVKNVIGAFYQPEKVVADPMFLNTLPQREIVCGLGEIVKHGALNAALFDKLYKNKENLRSLEFIASVVAENIAHKAHVVSVDEKETGIRKSLNMGHTTGHAIELYFGNMSHGACVLTGMYIETILAERKGVCKKEYADKLKELIVAALGGAPSLKGVGGAAYLAKMDKKNPDGATIVITAPKDKGEYAFISVPYDEYAAFLNEISGGKVNA